MTNQRTFTPIVIVRNNGHDQMDVVAMPPTRTRRPYVFTQQPAATYVDGYLQMICPTCAMTSSFDPWEYEPGIICDSGCDSVLVTIPEFERRVGLGLIHPDDFEEGN